MPGDRRPFAVVVNAAAGSAERAAVAPAVAALAEAAPVRLLASESPDDLDTLLAELGDQRLVVAGGDGSIHAAVAALRRAGRLGTTPLGLLPLGTGNDLARGLGLPLDPVEAARRTAGGRPRPCDLLVDDVGGLVLNAAHVGLGARAAARAEGLKARLGPLAYPAGALAEGLTASGEALRVEVDGEALPVAGPVLLAGVGNGPTIGGGTPLFPGARVDDGRLDVVVAAAVRPAARAAFALALRRGRHVDRDDVVMARGTTARITGAPVDLDVDGELEHGVADRTWRVEPAAWSLVA